MCLQLHGTLAAETAAKNAALQQVMHSMNRQTRQRSRCLTRACLIAVVHMHDLVIYPYSHGRAYKQELYEPEV